MRNVGLFFTALCIAAPLSVGAIGCSDGANELSDSDQDEEVESEEQIGEVSSQLVATDTVAKLIADECNTSGLKGLSIQLVEELNCLRPDTMGRIDNLDKVQLGSAALPFLQKPVVEGLKKVVAALNLRK